MTVGLTDTNGPDAPRIVLCASPVLPNPTPMSKRLADRFVSFRMRMRVQKDAQRPHPRCLKANCRVEAPFGLMHVANRKQTEIPEWLVGCVKRNGN
jgi:hypothetical protein